MDRHIGRDDATQLGRHYLLACTDKLNDRGPIRESINPFGTPGLHSNTLGPNFTLIGASDLNDDGIPDLLVGAPTFVHSNLFGVHSNAGTVFAFSGAQLRAGGSFTHSNALWTVSAGTHSNAQFGFSVAGHCQRPLVRLLGLDGR